MLAGNVSYVNVIDPTISEVGQDNYVQSARIWNVDDTYLFTVERTAAGKIIGEKINNI